VLKNKIEKKKSIKKYKKMMNNEIKKIKNSQIKNRKKKVKLIS